MTDLEKLKAEMEDAEAAYNARFAAAIAATRDAYNALNAAADVALEGLAAQPKEKNDAVED